MWINILRYWTVLRRVICVRFWNSLVQVVAIKNCFSPFLTCFYKEACLMCIIIVCFWCFSINYGPCVCMKDITTLCFIAYKKARESMTEDVRWCVLKLRKLLSPKPSPMPKIHIRGATLVFISDRQLHSLWKCVSNVDIVAKIFVFIFLTYSIHIH